MEEVFATIISVLFGIILDNTPMDKTEQKDPNVNKPAEITQPVEQNRAPKREEGSDR